MSVLENMRSGSDSTFMQVIMALVVVSFVGWFAQPQGQMGTSVAEVNGVQIPDTVFGRQYRQELSVREARAGRPLSSEEQAGVRESVRLRLIEDQVVLQEANALGITVSDNEVARFVFNQPFAQDAKGDYSEENYMRFLKGQMRMTRPNFEETQREVMKLRKLRLLVYTGASVSRPELEVAYSEVNTKVDVRYVRVRPSAFNEDVQVESADVDQYLIENEDEIKLAFERDFERKYNLPERVHLQMIRMVIDEENPIGVLIPRMNELRDQLINGADFTELANEHSADQDGKGGDLALRPVEQLGNEEGAAVEGLLAGDITQAVTTGIDVRLYKVIERVAPEQSEFETVKREISEDMIRAERGPALAAAFAEETLLVQWVESGELPADLVDSKGLISLTTGEISVMPDARNPFGPPASMLAAARDAAPGTVFPQVFESGGTLWVAQLISRTDADMAAFETEAEAIREGVLEQKRIEFYLGWVAAAKARATIR